MNQQPLVSVILATYNRAAIVSSSIESVIGQTYTNWELIVVDDRSTDHTKELIEQYCLKDARIKYVVNDRTKGVPGPKNCGMLQAKGEYIAFLDSDDQWFDCHLLDSMRIIEEKKVDICFAFWKEQVNGKVNDVFDDISYQQRLESVQKTSMCRMMLLFSQLNQGCWRNILQIRLVFSTLLQWYLRGHYLKHLKCLAKVMRPARIARLLLISSIIVVSHCIANLILCTIYHRTAFISSVIAGR